MTGVEIDFVVKDSLAALALYERIFEVERVEVTAFPQGKNEAIFNIYGTRFHLLDENPQFGLHAPTPGVPQSIWFNILVPHISKVHAIALDAGCQEIQPVTEMMDFGVSNSVFSDPFGYVWMLHKIHKVISLEERVALWENKNE